LKGVFIIAFVFVAFTAAASATTIGFVSDTSWQVFQGEAGFIGNAQTVCLSNSAPTNCPAGAVVYGYPGGWGTNLTAIPGAHWIWGPEVNGNTSPSEMASYSFIKSFLLNGIGPFGGSIMISADDFAEVFVNEHSVGTVGSTSVIALAGQKGTLTLIDISAFLHSGLNTIEIFAQNGIGSFGGCQNCTYSQNPAGLVFGGSFSFTEAHVPEPGTISLFAAGISLIALGRYRHFQRRR
jgi:hypothetical protein